MEVEAGGRNIAWDVVGERYYRTALLSPDRVWKEFEERFQAGMMVTWSFWEAKKVNGERLAIASLALVEEEKLLSG